MEFRFILLFFTLFFSFETGLLPAQDRTQQVLNTIYNQEFEEALAAIQYYQEKSPADSESNLLYVFYLRWKHIPIFQQEQHSLEYLQTLDKVVAQSEKALIKDPKSPKALYYMLSACMFLSEYHGMKENYIQGLSVAKKMYPYLLQTFDMQDEHPEFLFFQGLYYYYTEKYREKGLFYKSLLYPFKSGEPGEGMQLLTKSVAINSYSQTEALMFLTHLKLRYENKASEALKYAQALHQKHPQNIKYREMLVEVLIANGKWTEAQDKNVLILQQKDPYFRLGGAVFQAIIELNVTKNLQAAEQHLIDAKTLNAAQKKLNRHFESLCLLTESKIQNTKGQSKLATENYKKAQVLAPYPYIFESKYLNQP